jgi:hypothetical protein
MQGSARRLGFSIRNGKLPTMSDATSTPAQKNQLRKLILDLIFTLAIPVALLSPSLLGKDSKGDGIGFSDILGNVTTYIIAALIPVTYIAIDLLRTRVINPVTLLAGSGALAGGALAFLRIDGAAFALKDSYRHMLTALVMGGSLILGTPFFKFMLKVGLGAASPPDKQGLLERILNAPNTTIGLRYATIIMMLEGIVFGVVNFLVNYRIVTAKFDTKAFNSQVATANTTLYVPSLLATFAALALAYYLVQRGIHRDFSKDVQLFDEESWEKIDPRAAEVLEPTAQP